jgi:hypothetical protein
LLLGELTGLARIGVRQRKLRKLSQECNNLSDAMRGFDAGTANSAANVGGVHSILNTLSLCHQTVT